MIRIAQYRGISTVSKVIKWQTWGTYSHTAILLEDDRIVEAWEGTKNVRVIKSLSDGHTPGTVVDLFVIPTTPVQERIYRNFIEKQIGCDYDFWGIAAFMLRSNVSKPGSWFCSEVQAAACIQADVPLFSERVPAYKVSPELTTRSPLPRQYNSIVTS